MLDINSLIAAKADRHEDWDRILRATYKSLADQKLNDDEFEQLVSACSAPEQWAALSREFYRFSKQDGQQRSAFLLLQKEIDESEYELSQWVEAICYVLSWLDSEKKTASFDTILGYLNCCALAPDQAMARRFVDVVEEFIRDHGFERAQSV